jgi:Domain of unknown function (DUF4150)/GHH signature containing HNH/Endo VII superfamily nuclease toxin  2
MTCNVFANGREIACKASDGKSVAAFPDVCLSPPSPPAGPIPIPYPNTGFARDTTSGSKTVKLHGKEAMLKDKSYFKKSTGDEPAGKALGMGVITHQIQGKVYFASFSMDVFIEGQNVVRHLDLTTHNHGSVPGNTPTWPFIARTEGAAVTGPCEDNAKKEERSCGNFKPHNTAHDAPDVCTVLGLDQSKDDRTEATANKLAKRAAGEADKSTMTSEQAKNYDKAANCMKARRCQLAAIEPTGNQGRCCPSQTAHHMIPASAVFDQGRGGTTKKKNGKRLTSVPLQDVKNYDQGKAPCVCVEGTNQNHATHGKMHTLTSYLADKSSKQTAEWVELDQAAVDALAKLENDTPLAERTNLPIKQEHGKTLLDTRTLTYQQARDQSIKAFRTTFGENCSAACLAAQLDAYHKDRCKMKDDTKIKTVIEGRCSEEDVKKAGGELLVKKINLKKHMKGNE